MKLKVDYVKNDQSVKFRSFAFDGKPLSKLVDLWPGIPQQIETSYSVGGFDENGVWEDLPYIYGKTSKNLQLSIESDPFSVPTEYFYCSHHRSIVEI